MSPRLPGATEMWNHARVRPSTRGQRPGRVWILGAALALGLGCGQESSFVALPEGVDYVGALLVSSGSAEGTGLLRADEAREIEVPAQHSAFVYGFDQTSLGAALGRVPTEAQIDGALRATSGCEARLPVPAWLEGLSLPDGPALKTEDAPRLTASWVPELCPDTSMTPPPGTYPSPVLRIGAESSCSGIRCGVSVDGCTLRWDLRTCVRGSLSALGQVDFEGRVCAELPECSVERATPSSDATFTCGLTSGSGECKVELYGVPRPLPAEIELVEIHPGREGVAPLAQLGRDSLGRGLTWAFVVLTDTVVLSSPSPAEAGVPTASCPGNAPSLLSFVDRDPLGLIRTATAPPCMIDLAADPDRSSFVAVYGVWPEIYVGRFDESGRELHRRRLDTLEGLPEAIQYSALEVEVTPSGRVVLILRDQTSGVGSSVTRSELVVVLGPDLDLVRRSEPLNAELRHLAIGGETRMLIGDPRDHTIRWFELPSLELVSRGAISNLNRAAEFMHLDHLHGDEAVLSLAGAFGRFGRVAAALDGEATLRPWAWGDAEPTSSSAWPLDPELRLVALRPGRWDGTPTSSLSALALFSTKEDRYLPMASLVGEHGAATRAFTSPEGEVWLMYPWVGRLMRVKPRPE